MPRPDALARSTLRWGGAIALLLVCQSVLLAGLFWLLASRDQVRQAERRFSADCAAMAVLSPGARSREVRAMLRSDVHRDRFLALFARDGSLIEGNVAGLPPGLVHASTSTVATVTPTELPGKSSDTARLAVCALPDGTRLLTGLDLDEWDRTGVLIARTLLVALVPGLLLALGFGLLAGRRAGRQVDAVRRLSTRIVAGDLDRRLSVPAKPDSFGLLCMQINAMLDRIGELMIDLRGIGDDIAHQVRTPLTRLRAKLERITEAPDHAGTTTAAAAALVEIDGVLAIVAALLRIRELEDHARRSRFAPVDLVKLVTDAVELHAPGAEDSGVALRLRVVAPATVTGDADLLMEAVSNLVDNAVKFGPPGGAVDLVLDRVDGRPRMSVLDQGSGVPPADRDLVTQRFYRGYHDKAGVGLGLSLVQAIVELHGCRLLFADDGVSILCASDGV